MAISSLVYQSELNTSWYVIAAVISVAIGLISILKRSQIQVPAATPKFASGRWPIVGNFQFFSARWDFHKSQAKHSPTGNWSYYVGDMPVVGLSGDRGRKVFFENKKLDMDAGYKGLFAGSPDAPTEGKLATQAEDSGPSYFTRRILQVLKRDRLQRILPTLIKDLQFGLDELASQKDKVTDPFNSIYDFLYTMIVRVTACVELAEDHKSRRKLLSHYEMIEKSGTPWVIMFPRLPTLGSLKRLYGGIYVWTTFDKIIKDRKKSGRREDDPLQILMDDGDDTTQIITFIIGALYTGQLNSGINAGWIIVFLATNPDWHAACFAEVKRAVDKHTPFDPQNPESLSSRLASLPFEAWEEEFPIIDACLRDTIRITVPGSMFRRNTSGEPIPINDREVVPPGFFTSYAIADIHQDPSIYPDPIRWNPGRYVNFDGTPATYSQGDSNSRNYTYLGWGAARHPCLGMKFAKLEMYLVVAFWLAYFDFELDSHKGRLPHIDMNAFSPEKPQEKVQLRYWLRGAEKSGIA